MTAYAACPKCKRPILPGDSCAHKPHPREVMTGVGYDGKPLGDVSSAASAEAVVIDAMDPQFWKKASWVKKSERFKAREIVRALKRADLLR